MPDFNTPLSDMVERVERSIFHSIRKELVLKEYLPDITTFPQTQQGYDDYRQALVDVRNIQGFAIEIFNASSPHAKNLKKAPRIVIIPNRRLPGALGGSPDRIYDLDPNSDPLDPRFNASIMPPQVINYQFDVHMISESAKQSRIMHGIVALAVPTRGYVKLYDEPEEMFFVRQYSYRDIQDSDNDINEEVYLYEAMDIQEIECRQVDENIPQLREINVDIQEGDVDNSKDVDNMTVNDED